MEEMIALGARKQEEMMADLVSKFLWVFFTAFTVGIVVLIETLLLNRGCHL